MAKALQIETRPNQMTIWDLERMQCLGSTKEAGDWCRVAVADFDSLKAVTAALDHSVLVWDMRNLSMHVSKLSGHSRAVTSLAAKFSSGQVASGAADADLRIWKLDENGGLPSCREFQGHTDEVKSIAVDFDRGLAASLACNGSPLFWNLAEDFEDDPPPPPKSIPGEHSRITSMDTSFEWQTTITATTDSIMRVYQWGANDVQEVIGDGGALLEGHTDVVSTVRANFKKKEALSGSNDRTLRFWDLDYMECQGVMEGHTGSIRTLEADFVSMRALSGAADCTLRCWDLETQECVGVLEGHRCSPDTTIASFRHNRAVSTARDGMLQLWDLEAAQSIASIEGHVGSIFAPQIAPNAPSLTTNAEI